MDQRLQDIFAAALNIPASAVEAELDRRSVAEWDSLNHLRLVHAFEQQFGVQLTTAEILNLRTVGEFEQILRGDRGHA